MTATSILRTARAAGRASLSEAESRRLLAAYGVSFTAEREADDVGDACAAAAAIGYPVVLKGCGAAFTHKTELDLVALGLADEAAVSEAAADLLGRMAGEGTLLVQPMVRGRREFMLGLSRDPQFGPVVTFGVGGVFAEIADDVAMRLVPLSEPDARAMLDEIRAAALLDGIRGMAPVDRDALVTALLGLARLAVECPDVAAVDVNPVIATEDGRPIAVDALVLLAAPEN